MQKLSNFTGQARHGWEKMTPAAFGMGRQHLDNNSHSAHPPVKRSLATAPLNALNQGDGMYTISFNVPFSSNLAGPDPNEIIHASPDAFEKWTHPDGTPEGTPIHKLPVHARNVENLRTACKLMGETSPGRVTQAAVTSTETRQTSSINRGQPKGLVTNVCISGLKAEVPKLRAKLLNETPIALVH